MEELMIPPVRRGAAAALSLLLALPAATQPVDEASIDAIVLQAMDEQRIPGVAVGVMRRGQLVLKKGYGLANVELRVPVTPESVFQSGSVGKMFTATAIMLLVSDGKLRLDDKVARYFPDAPESWEDMTVRHLLSHTSGVSEALYTSIDLHRDYSDAELVRRIQSRPLDFPPGTDFKYSNPGYMMLGLLVQKVTGHFYGHFLKDRVFEPLGMMTAQVNDIRAIVPGRVDGYVLAADGTLLRDDWVSPTFSVTADGSLLFGVLDLARWDAALYSEALLPGRDLQCMWQGGPLKDGTLHPANYGFGWATKFVRGHRMVGHSGGWQGFSTYFARYVDDELSIAVLANLDAAELARIVKRIAAAIVPELAPYERITDPDSALTERLRQVVRSYLSGEVEREAFSDQALAQWNEMQYRRDARSVQSIDDDTQFELVDRRRQAPYEFRTYRLSGERHDSAYLVRVSLTPNGKIAGLLFGWDY